MRIGTSPRHAPQARHAPFVPRAFVTRSGLRLTCRTRTDWALASAYERARLAAMAFRDATEGLATLTQAAGMAGGARLEAYWKQKARVSIAQYRLATAYRLKLMRTRLSTSGQAIMLRLADGEVWARRMLAAGRDFYATYKRSVSSPPTDALVHLSQALSAWDTEQYVADLTLPEFTAGSNSTQLLDQLEGGLSFVAKVLARNMQRATQVAQSLKVALDAGTSMYRIAVHLARPFEKVNAGNALQIVQAALRRNANGVKAFASRAAASLEAFVQAYQRTRSRETDAARMQNMLAILDVVSSLGSSIGTTGSALAAVASARVRYASAAARKQTIVDLESAGNASEAALKAAKDNYASARALANIGGKQLVSWAIAFPGSWGTASSKQKTLDRLARGGAPGPEDQAVLRRALQRQTAFARAAGFQPTLLSPMWTSQWAALGRAMYFATMETLAAHHSDKDAQGRKRPFGVIEVPLGDAGPKISDGLARQLYRQAFLDWLKANPVARDRIVDQGVVYYYLGHKKSHRQDWADDVDDRLTLKIFAQEVPAMRLFPRLRTGLS